MKVSNPKAVVNVEVDNELVHPKISIEYCKLVRIIDDSLVNGRKTDMSTTNMSFRQILHTIQDELREVDLEADKENYDKFRKMQQDYILGGIKKWEQKHLAMIKELEKQ